MTDLRELFIRKLEEGLANGEYEIKFEEGRIVFESKKKKEAHEHDTPYECAYF